jgi:hypothetical protein
MPTRAGSTLSKSNAASIFSKLAFFGQSLTLNRVGMPIESPGGAITVDAVLG